MSVILYNIFLWLFRLGTHIASLFDPKAKKWVSGRKGLFQKLEQAIPAAEKVIWVHCASLGEFEQGRPVMEKLRQTHPGYRILLTFFSPSGYEVQKNYPGADWVFYLPLDGPRTAKRFLEIVHPSLVIFVKYEFWFYYLKKIKYRNIPLILISALFREDMSFFKWYGKLQRKMLSRFDHLFVQNASSKKLVDDLGLADITTVSGDTRFDRVIEIAEKFEPVPAVEKFLQNSKAIVAGSTWPDDEEVLQAALPYIRELSLKLIIAPHEIGENHITTILKQFPEAVLFSQLEKGFPSSANTLIVDNVGMLSRLYYYAWITYVGGGMKPGGVHNVLEAAVYNKIVLFGPYYKKYSEAVGLEKCGGAIPFEKGPGEILIEINRDRDEYANRSAAAGNYVRSNGGATKKILAFIQEKRLLTN